MRLNNSEISSHRAGKFMLVSSLMIASLTACHETAAPPKTAAISQEQSPSADQPVTTVNPTITPYMSDLESSLSRITDKSAKLQYLIGQWCIISRAVLAGSDSGEKIAGARTTDITQVYDDLHAQGAIDTLPQTDVPEGFSGIQIEAVQLQNAAHVQCPSIVHEVGPVV